MTILTATGWLLAFLFSALWIHIKHRYSQLATASLTAILAMNEEMEKNNIKFDHPNVKITREKRR
jgi:hypothetical protein